MLVDERVVVEDAGELLDLAARRGVVADADAEAGRGAPAAAERRLDALTNADLARECGGDGIRVRVVERAVEDDVGEQAAYPFLVDELKFIDLTLSRGIPFLGICLGGQLLAHALGEEVGPHPETRAEYGYYDLIPTEAGRAEFGPGLKVLQSHWHGWYRTPKDAVKLAHSAGFPEQAFRYGDNAYGIQFHPEASRTMLTRWIGRRPPERHALAGAFPPERQLADYLLYDRALGDWFHDFLGRWSGIARRREAAE